MHAQERLTATAAAAVRAAVDGRAAVAGQLLRREVHRQQLPQAHAAAAAAAAARWVY
jgi:hypothetical protein